MPQPSSNVVLFAKKGHSLCTCFEECAASVSDVIDNDGHPVSHVSHQHHSVHLIRLLPLREGGREEGGEREGKGRRERGGEINGISCSGGSRISRRGVPVV